MLNPRACAQRNPVTRQVGWAAFGLSAALLSWAAAAPGTEAARLAPRPRGVRPAAPSPDPHLLYHAAARSRIKTASPDELRQFYAELAARGWRNVQIVPICTAYARTATGVEPVGSHFATLYGDVDGDGKPEWVIGCHFPSPTIEDTRPVPDGAARTMMDSPGDRARIVVFKRVERTASRDGGQWKIQWLSPGLGDEFRPLEYNLREVADDLDNLEHLRIPLSLVDLEGDGHLEIAYQCWSKSGGLGPLPGLYRWNGSRWANIAPQADRFSLLDLNQDGKLEVVTGSRYVGYGHGDDDVPHVWRWNGRQYQEASSEFPKFYAQLATRYRKYVERKERNGESFDRAAWGRAIQKATSLAG